MLPNIPPFDCITDWISGVAVETSDPFPDEHDENSGARKRRLSDSSVHGSLKRPRVMDELASGRSITPDFPLSSLNSEYDLVDVLSQIDFSLPPPASFSSALGEGESLQLDGFAYSNDPCDGLASQDSKLIFCIRTVLC